MGRSVPLLSIPRNVPVSGLTSLLTWELPVFESSESDPLPATNRPSKTPKIAKATAVTPALTWELPVFDPSRLNASLGKGTSRIYKDSAVTSLLTWELPVFDPSRSAPLLCKIDRGDTPYFSRVTAVTPLTGQERSPAMLIEFSHAC